MIAKYTKGHLLFFLVIIIFLSGCGESIAAQTVKNQTPLHIPSLPKPRPLTPGVRVTATATATTTPQPTATQSTAPTPTTPPNGQRFGTLPPGSALPSDAECAARVRHTSEIHPDNTTANNTNLYLQGVRLTGTYLEQYGYQDRVTGNFTGTTDEILQWGACKWGIDEDIVRAQAQNESTWHQSLLADCNGGATVPATHGCQSVGIIQIKGADLPPTYPGTWPYVYESTAMNVDFAYGVWRACYEGKETWLDNGYKAGDVWGCVGRWFSGDWYQNSQQYISDVQTHVADKDWLKPGF